MKIIKRYPLINNNKPFIKIYIFETAYPGMNDFIFFN